MSGKYTIRIFNAAVLTICVLSLLNPCSRAELDVKQVEQLLFVLANLDLNQDAQLDLTEFIKGFPTIASILNRPIPPQIEIEGIFLRYDTNTDGFLTLDEMPSAIPVENN